IQKTLSKKLPSGPQGITFKSFRVEAKVKIELAGKIRHISLDIDYTHVDQGADLNLISHELAKILKLPSIKLPQPIFFGTAEGRLTSATHYTEIKIGVSGIWRHAEALLLPPTSGNPRSHILGLPLNIPKFTLTIGDPEKGEIVVNIQTTKFKLGQNNRLRLVLAEKRTIELAKAQITAKNNRNQKNSRIQKENLSDTESDYENSSGTSENQDETKSVSSKSSGKESVTGRSSHRTKKKKIGIISSKTLDKYFLRDQELIYDYQNLDKFNNPLTSIHGATPNAENFSLYTSEAKVQDAKNAAFPTNRRPTIRPLSNDPHEVIVKWFSKCGAVVGPLCPTIEDKFNVARLFYTYKDLNATELSEMAATDLLSRTNSA
ncbi:hypothetical protein OnM2_027092, partial [Erysiphe neolycopersici]